MAADQASALTVGVQWDDGVATVTVQGEIDISTASVFSGRLGEVARQNPQRLVIDLAGVDFLDSAGLQAFVAVRRALPQHCAIVLRSPQRRARQVFDMTGLSAAFVFE